MFCRAIFLVGGGGGGKRGGVSAGSPIKTPMPASTAGYVFFFSRFGLRGLQSSPRTSGDRYPSMNSVVKLEHKDVDAIPFQEASLDIWDKKYRLSAKDGTPVDKTMDDTRSEEHTSE